MGMRDYFAVQSGEFGFMWKYQMFVGVLVLFAGLLIALFPEILVALVAAATMLVGISLIGSAWRLRRLQQRSERVGYVETFEW